MPSRDLKAVSLFTGAGGLDIGIERAGFATVSAVEFEERFVETLRMNQKLKHPVDGKRGHYHLDGTNIFHADVRDISASDLWTEDGPPDLLVGGPPCQSFSSAGKMGSISDPRGQLVYEFLRLARDLRPRAILFENVRGLVTARGPRGEPGEVLDHVLDELASIGFSCSVGLLNAADFGAPQRRVRCFIVGLRGSRSPALPASTHARQATKQLQTKLSLEGTVAPWVTLGDFLREHADLASDKWVRPTPAMERQLRAIPDGRGLKSAGVAEATRPGGHWGYKQGGFIADQTLPARTVTGSTSQDWIRLSDGSLRRLTLNEVAGLQGFPPDWYLAGSKAQQFKQVGNAVPTIFGQVLGLTLANCLRNHGPETTSIQVVRAKLPENIMGAIAYTKREEQRNGASRAAAIRVAVASSEA
jgi:DNA (cytosine-5)-methyltransferase 1